MTDDELIEAVRHEVERRADASGQGDNPDGSSIDPRLLANLTALSAGIRDMLGVESKEPGVLQTPATAEEIDEAERTLGAPLPALLRRLYAEIGNGGFGPSGGLLGLTGGATDDRGKTAIELHRLWAAETAEVLLPICHWGCGIYSMVECSPTPGRMWGFDPNADLGGDHPLRDDDLDLRRWLTLWLEGSLRQVAATRDDGSGQWRLATQAEVGDWLE